MNICTAFARTTLSNRSAFCSSNGKKDRTRAQITHARSLLVRLLYLTFLPIWSNQRSKGTTSSSASGAAAAGATAAAAGGCDDEDEDEDDDEDDAAEEEEEEEEEVEEEEEEAEEEDGLRRKLGPCGFIDILILTF
jgi:hypothetical protein